MDTNLEKKKIKAVTFNIRCDYGQDEGNSFSFRKEGILRKILAEKPDVLCFQEVLPHVALWLKKELGDYLILGCGRTEDFGDESPIIGVKKERFDLVSMDTFWLSPSPYVPGSRYRGQSICPRTAAEAVVFDLQGRCLWRIVNTHLDHEGTEARREGLCQIMEKIAHPGEFEQAYTFLAGDFNALPDSQEMKVMEDYPEFTDVTAEAGGTFHDYGRTAPEKIDYIYAKAPLKALEVRLWEDRENGVYLSDHYPVCAELLPVEE